jgi:hypothetical protein
VKGWGAEEGDASPSSVETLAELPAFGNGVTRNFWLSKRAKGKVETRRQKLELVLPDGILLDRYGEC